MKNQRKRTFFRIFLVVLTLFLTLVPFDLEAAPKKKKSKKKKTTSKYLKIDLEFSQRAMYDNNILRYSDKYKARFENSQNPGRFDIETFDDMAFSTGARLDIRYPLIKKLDTRLRADFTNNKYMTNPVKDWYKFELSLRQEITKKASLTGKYEILPDYYVRRYKDDESSDDPDESNVYKPFSFAKEGIEGQVDYEILPGTDFMAAYSYSWYYHNKYFTEYDSENSQIELQLKQKINKMFTIKAAWRLLNSDATYYDDGAPLPEDPYPVPDYDREYFIGGVYCYFPKIFNMKNRLIATYYFNRKFYTTGLPPDIDPLHSGRKDYNHALRLNYKVSLTKDIDLAALIFYDSRNSGSTLPDNDEYIAEERDFRQFRFGLEFTYNLRLLTRKI
jgi:hypothetical protein